MVASAASSAAGVVQSLAPGLRELPSLPPGAGVLLCAGLLASQVARVFEPGMAPADVLAKTLQPLTDVISAEDRGTVAEDDVDDDDDSNKPPPPFVGKGGLPLL